MAQQRQHVDAVRVASYFSRVISVFVFNILQILIGCTQICSGRSAHTCTPLARGAVETVMFVNM